MAERRHHAARVDEAPGLAGPIGLGFVVALSVGEFDVEHVDLVDIHGYRAVGTNQE